MISQIRDNSLFKLLWGIIALYLFNISIDVADPFTNDIPENLTVNEQESVIELIVEQFLGFDSTFVEFDDQDADENGKKSNLKVELILLAIGRIATKVLQFAENNDSPLKFIAFLPNGSSENDPPPPKMNLC